MIDVQLSTAVKDADQTETIAHITTWVKCIFELLDKSAQELTVRIVDEEEIQQLNYQYRNKDAVTNVLSFPFDAVLGVEEHYLGDVVICFSVVKEESNQQDIEFCYYFARILAHGILHLYGYLHEDDEEAQVMEQMERQILMKLFAFSQSEVQKIIPIT